MLLDASLSLHTPTVVKYWKPMGWLNSQPNLQWEGFLWFFWKVDVDSICEGESPNLLQNLGSIIPQATSCLALCVLHLNDIFPPRFLHHLLATVRQLEDSKKVMMHTIWMHLQPRTSCSPEWWEAKANSPWYLYLPNKRARLRRRTRLENKREEEPPGKVADGPPGGPWQSQNWPNWLVDLGTFSIEQCEPELVTAIWRITGFSPSDIHQMLYIQLLEGSWGALGERKECGRGKQDGNGMHSTHSQPTSKRFQHVWTVTSKVA